ncbi:MAG: GNAT family N-acetyltransferase, partial [Pseudomonadota bacterium]
TPRPPSSSSKRPLQAKMPTTRLYRPEDARVFRELNVAWIERYFGLEAEDRAQLDDIEAAILTKGGRAIVAEHDGVVCGTVAVIPLEPGLVELAKMSVRTDLQGLGIGKALIEHAVLEAKRLDARSIWIESNDRLEAAIGLYRKAGFRVLPRDAWRPTPYDRCNIQLLLDLP